MISNEWTLEYERRLNKLAIWFWRIFISGFFAMILGSVVYWNYYFFGLLWFPIVLLFLWYFVILGFLVIALKLI
ncbi:hypothetical protein [Enterococcus mundtii]|uniref:hypothetical protein n=1 Tax=Enterococcus mundtii TaxID=53346 RepID=UPI00403CBF4A